MKPQDQTVFGDGSDGAEPGDCFRACVASLLDVSVADVPNFVASERWWDALVDFLEPRRVFPIILRPTEGNLYIPDGVHYIASGQSPRGFRHAVVFRDGAMVHDPHPSKAGLVSKPDIIYVFGLSL